MTIDNIRDIATVKEFVQTASRFCSLMENHSALSTYELAQQSAQILSVLYNLALRLPEANPHTSNVFQDPVPSERLKAMRLDLAARFGKLNSYRLIFDAYEDQDQPPVIATLADDLSDIYSELKIGSDTYRDLTTQGALEAVWHWKFGFMHHWGRHLTNALKAIHDLFAGYRLQESKTDRTGNGT